MTESSDHRKRPLSVRRGDLRVGDILNPDALYTGDDETLGAVCQDVSRFKGPYISVTWRITATGETYTNVFHEEDQVLLMRRAPAASPRDELWEQLGIDPDRVSRKEFDKYMDAYDRTAAAGPARSDEEPAS